MAAVILRFSIKQQYMESDTSLSSVVLIPCVIPNMDSTLLHVEFSIFFTFICTNIDCGHGLVTVHTKIYLIVR